jgi:hypothetical protein
MADFTPNARQRIIRTVRLAESGGFSRPPGGSRRGGGDELILARATLTYVAGEVGTFALQHCTGDKGEEDDFEEATELAYIRKGCVIQDSLYLLGDICGGDDTALEVVNPTTEVTCKTDGGHTKSSSGTVSIYKGANGAETDSGVNITNVYNRFADVASTKWVRVSWNDHSDGWELIAGECS